jgi:hypothetical protein
VIAQFGIVLRYFLFFHLTGQALSPSPLGRGKERSMCIFRGAPERYGVLININHKD